MLSSTVLVNNTQEVARVLQPVPVNMSRMLQK